MEKRKLLSWFLAAIMVLGLSLASIPFFISLAPSAKAENEAWGICDVSDIKPGEIQECGWAWVYRRTQDDKKAVHEFEKFLADPRSMQSDQPEATRNEWRSANPDYFVFKPQAPIRGCWIELRQSMDDFGWEPPEKEALRTLPYFTERCEGKTWDTSGRLYQRPPGYPPEKNLTVPRVRWVSETKVLIWGG